MTLLLRLEMEEVGVRRVVADIDEILDLERKWSIFFYLELEN